MSIDVVIPSIRLDMESLLGSLNLDVPENVDLRYYVVSDSHEMKSCEFEHRGNPVRVIVNEKSLGASLSRNVGLEAGSGKYVLFIDDDVVAVPDLLRAYLAAIAEDPDAPGYVGSTRFPDPVNSFTRGIKKSGMLHFFGRPEYRSRMAWGTTSNLMVRREAVGKTRFSKAFPRHGGGEDIDFCLRVVDSTGKWFRTVQNGPVNHPWWRNAKRSYVRFFRWSVGDSRLIRLHPKYAYRDFPNTFESLVFGAAGMACVAAAGVIPYATVGIWAGMVVLGDFLVEQWRGRESGLKPSGLDGIEVAAIRLSSELGKFLAPLARGDTSCLFTRMDFMCTGESIGHERSFSRAKFAIFSTSIPLAYLLGTSLARVPWF